MTPFSSHWRAHARSAHRLAQRPFEADRSGDDLTPEELARFPDEAVDAAKVGSIFTHCGLPGRLD